MNYNDESMNLNDFYALPDNQKDDFFEVAWKLSRGNSTIEFNKRINDFIRKNEFQQFDYLNHPMLQMAKIWFENNFERKQIVVEYRGKTWQIKDEWKRKW